MISRKQILWVDGFAGAIAGVAVLLASGWLCDLYRLPVSLLVFMRWAFVYAETASFFGLAQFIAEAIFVAGLASLEWRWRGQLLTA